MTSNPATIVYVGHGGSSDIHVLSLGADGKLSPVQTVPVPGVVKAGGSLPLAITPDQRFLHAALRGEPVLAQTFAIDPATGRLSHLGGAELADSMAYLASDRSGRWLLSASYGGNKVAVNSVGSDGIAGPVTQVVPTEPKAHSILASADNKQVLAASLGGDILLQFAFDAATGKLTPANPPSVRIESGAGPRHFRFHPTGPWVYLLGELDGSITLLDRDPASGSLTVRERASALPDGFTDKPWGADIQITPNGRYLYASERTSSTLAAFAIDAKTGSLRKIGSFATEKQPRGFAIDPTGRYLIAVGQASNGLTVHAIQQDTGALRDGYKQSMGTAPDWVEIITLG